MQSSDNILERKNNMMLVQIKNRLAFNLTAITNDVLKLGIWNLKDYNLRIMYEILFINYRRGHGGRMDSSTNGFEILLSKIWGKSSTINIAYHIHMYMTFRKFQIPWSTVLEKL
jgi:hypothetical protein